MDSTGWTALWLASLLNNTSSVKLLVGMGADPFISCAGGQTPLDIATEKGHTEVVAILRNAAEKVGAARSHRTAPKESC